LAAAVPGLKSALPARRYSSARRSARLRLGQRTRPTASGA
jgi:hypothetical protein